MVSMLVVWRVALLVVLKADWMVDWKGLSMAVSWVVM